MQIVQLNSIEIINRHKVYGRIKIQSFQPRISKSIIDKIDVEFGKLYGFSDEETDFLINYDIKYRMGSTDDEE
jgi:hypothetical protein